MGAKNFIVNCLCCSSHDYDDAIGCTSPVCDDADDAEMLAKNFKSNRLHSFMIALVSYYDNEGIDNHADADDDGDDDLCF